MHNKNTIIILIILMITAVTFITEACAETNYDNEVLLLKSGHINTDNQTYQQTNSTYLSNSMDEKELYYIVQFTGPVKDEWKQSVKSTGASIYNYIPNNAFVFRMSDGSKDQVQSMDFVQWVGEYKSSYKYIVPLSEDNSINLSGIDIENKTKYNILLFSESHSEDVSIEIESLGGTVLSSHGNVMRIEIQESRLPEIASIDGISWIEEYVQTTLNNDVAETIMNADDVHENFSLKGNGQIVAVCDTGLDTGVNDNSMHADIRNRILNIIDYSDNGAADNAPAAYGGGHGTHVSGSVLGNGAMSGGQYSGTAPEATLLFQAVQDADGSLGGIDDIGDISVFFQDAYDQGARIHTNSWGKNTYGAYTIESQQVDQFMWDHPDMLILFSAGNSGRDLDYDGVINRGSVGSPGTAKNCLTVGASENYRPDILTTYGTYYSYISIIKDDYRADNADGIAAFSSRGPTDDGRIKPDLVAPGTYINSVKSSYLGSEYYQYMSGTSMATPLTAGTAAIVRQYYNDIEDLSNPSAALIKATLINGAYNITPGQYGTGRTQEVLGRPDYSQGWGRVDIENSIYPQYPGVVKYFDKIPLSAGESWDVSFDVADGSENLRATLVWTDYPGDAAVELQLVNNLDLIVTTPEGNFYGNGAADTVNNVEGVELLNPVAGTYTFTVIGTNVPQGPQNFSLVLYFEPEYNEYPENNAVINNDTTAVSFDLIYPGGINTSSIVMTIDYSEVSYSLEMIDDGYRVKYLTDQPYTQGEHSVSVTAMTNQRQEICHEWTFYGNFEPVIYDMRNSSTLSSTTLSWNQEYTDHVEVWRNQLFIANTSESQIKDKGLVASTIYQYSLKPVDSSGNSGNWYNVSVATKKIPTIIINDLITDISSSSTSSTITLSWNHEDAEYVEVWRNQVFVTNSSESQITDTGLTANTVYSYSLKPVGSSDTGSNWYNISVATKTTPIITDLTKSSNSSSITLSWNQEYTNHVEIWRDQAFVANISESQFTDVDLSANTIYKYTLLPVDEAGNIGNRTNTTVSTSILSSTGSSSGGGGGSSTGEKYENIQFKDVLSVYTKKGEVTDFDFHDDNNDIDYIRYTSLKNAGKISVTVEVLKGDSSFTDSPAPGVVYKNMNIWVGKTGYATDSNIENPVIGFRLTREWVKENNIDPATISIYRYSDDEWTALSTKQTDADEEYLYFEAITPGFSPFAISGEKMVTESVESINNQVNAGSPMQSYIEDNTVPEDNKSLPAISGLLTMSILATTCILLRRQQN